MRTIDKIYIDGAFVTPHGSERFDLFNPATKERIGSVRLGDAEEFKEAGNGLDVFQNRAVVVFNHLLLETAIVTVQIGSATGGNQ